MSVLVASVSACAARASRPTLSTAAYSCGERQVRRDGGKVYTEAADHLTLGWQDAEGDHFVAWPTATTTMEAVEYVIPRDARADAIERVYDTSRGTSRIDWRVTKQNTCTAEAGYTQALATFATGKSFEQVAAELKLSNKAEARDLVHQALLSVQKRYFRDR
ncbi:MAG TPA: hypothetical protein VFQ53_41355 [Kofleriaceae bacterium]|nr:hypothetical protein [Kofleriaceae bacterium]